MTRQRFKVDRGWGLGGAILLTGCLMSGFRGNYALAQIIPDGTLGAESSLVTPNVTINSDNADRIDGGAIRGTNLFHSFEQFNIGDGQRVYFASPAGIENILSRVTGNNTSLILGTLGVIGGNANLFLMNPNGIIFGANARLDVGGSFVATTANAIEFGNQGFFSASTPESPSLLAVNPSAFLFNQIHTARIENHSIAPTGVHLVGEELFGLQVPEGRSFLLLGGDIVLDGGGLTASSGRVELAGVAGSGTIGLNVNGNNLSLNFPQDVIRADISLTNKAVVSTSGKGGGEIQVWGRRVTLNEGSQIVGTTLGEEAGGGLTVNASESVELAGTGFENFEQTYIAAALSGQLRLFNPGTGLFTGTAGTGAAGAIKIDTKQLILRDGAVVFSPTFSQGAGGSLTVRASESVEAIGSGLITSTLIGTKAAGNIAIETRRLIIRDGAFVATATLGEGVGGEMVVKASESVEVLRTPPKALVTTGLFTSTVGGSGAAGAMIIDTERLIIRGGAQIATQSGGTTLGIPANAGQGGDLVIRASEFIEISDLPKDVFYQTALLSGTEGSGQGGNLTISAPLLRVLGGQILASTSGTGDSGNVTIDTGVLIVQDGGIIAASSALGEGDGGKLTITASESVQLIGKSADGQIQSGLFTDTKIRGNAGDITIETPLLLVQDGARISAETSAGVGGSITITANNVELINNGQIRTTTAGRENAGNILLTAQESLILSGTDSGLLANTTEGSSSNGGSIFIRNPTSIMIRDGARVAVDSQGTGVGGNIDIQAGSMTLENHARLLAETASNTGGNITLQLQDLLLLRNNGKISTAAGTTQAGGDGGNIRINTGFIVALPKEDSDITADAFQGRGGNINITATSIYGIEFRPRLTPLSDITASSDFGVDGIVSINQLDVDPVRGIVTLPSEPVNSEVAQDCQTTGGKASGSFINTGRGGLPSNPYEPLTSSEILADVQPPSQWMENSTSPFTQATFNRLVEANGWRMKENGEVVLVVQASPTPSQWGCRLR